MPFVKAFLSNAPIGLNNFEQVPVRFGNEHLSQWHSDVINSSSSVPIREENQGVQARVIHAN